MAVRFLLDGETVELAEVDPTETLLDLLRYRLRRTGTKEGCAEGDCGACTVLVGEVAEGALTWRAVNACILFVPMLDGRALLTVESLGTFDALAPVQAAMAADGGSQCGFCTPGFVMSLHGRSIGAVGHDLPVADVIAGNLCRCTGYGPILDAGERIAPCQRDDDATIAALAALPRDAGGTWQGRRWFAPRNLDALLALLADHPEAQLIAGATDVGLWVTKGLRTFDTVVFLGDVAELRVLAEDVAGLRIGATVRYADAHAALARLHPAAGELVRRIGGLQVRNAGTIGGNIANGSPIGDTPPALIALGATLVLRSAAGTRTMPIEDYFLDYGRQDRRPGEIVARIDVPRPDPATLIAITKLAKRFDSDISAVCAAFALTMAGETIVATRIAFGGMAGIPRRAPACEAALTGQLLTPATLNRAAAALAEDFTPLTDVRGSADYRLTVAGNLLRRLWHERQGEAVSVLSVEAGRG